MRARDRVRIGPARGCAAVLVLCAMLQGCSLFQMGGSSERGAGLTVSAVRHPILEDIPKPAGFSLVDDRSVARSSGRYRVAKVEFVGNTHRDAVNRFYKEYMPSAGFTLSEERFDRGEYEMRFESQTESCTIRIRPERFRTTIVVDIGPLPEGTVERAARPITRRP